MPIDIHLLKKAISLTIVVFSLKELWQFLFSDGIWQWHETGESMESRMISVSIMVCSIK